MILDEDVGYEMARQQRIDELTDEEFAALIQQSSIEQEKTNSFTTEIEGVPV